MKRKISLISLISLVVVAAVATVIVIMSAIGFKFPNIPILSSLFGNEEQLTVSIDNGSSVDSIEGHSTAFTATTSVVPDNFSWKSDDDDLLTIITNEDGSATVTAGFVDEETTANLTYTAAYGTQVQSETVEVNVKLFDDPNFTTTYTIADNEHTASAKFANGTGVYGFKKTVELYVKPVDGYALSMVKVNGKTLKFSKEDYVFQNGSYYVSFPSHCLETESEIELVYSKIKVSFAYDDEYVDVVQPTGQYKMGGVYRFSAKLKSAYTDKLVLQVFVNGEYIEVDENGKYEFTVSKAFTQIKIKAVSPLSLSIEVERNTDEAGTSKQLSLTTFSANAAIVAKMSYAKAKTDTDYQFGVRLYDGSKFLCRMDIRLQNGVLTLFPSTDSSKAYTYTNPAAVKAALAGKGLKIVIIRRGTDYYVFTDDGKGNYVYAFDITLKGDEPYTKIGFGVQPTISTGDTVSCEMTYYDGATDYKNLMSLVPEKIAEDPNDFVITVTRNTDSAGTSVQKKLTAESANAVTVAEMTYSKAKTDSDYQFGVRLYDGNTFASRIDIRLKDGVMTLFPSSNKAVTYTYEDTDAVKAALARDGLTVVIVRQGTSYAVWTNDGNGNYVLAFETTIKGESPYTKIGFGVQSNIDTGDKAACHITYHDGETDFYKVMQSRIGAISTKLNVSTSNGTARAVVSGLANTYQFGDTVNFKVALAAGLNPETTFISSVKVNGVTISAVNGVYSTVLMSDHLDISVTVVIKGEAATLTVNDQNATVTFISGDPSNVKVCDELSFTVAADEYYTLSKVLYNDEELTAVDGVYTIQIQSLSCVLEIQTQSRIYSATHKENADQRTVTAGSQAQSVMFVNLKFSDLAEISSADSAWCIDIRLNSGTADVPNGKFYALSMVYRKGSLYLSNRSAYGVTFANASAVLAKLDSAEGYDMILVRDGSNLDVYADDGNGNIGYMASFGTGLGDNGYSLIGYEANCPSAVEGCMTRANVETGRTRQISWTNYDGYTSDELTTLAMKELGLTVEPTDSKIYSKVHTANADQLAVTAGDSTKSILFVNLKFSDLEEIATDASTWIIDLRLNAENGSGNATGKFFAVSMVWNKGTLYLSNRKASGVTFADPSYVISKLNSTEGYNMIIVRDDADLKVYAENSDGNIVYMTSFSDKLGTYSGWTKLGYEANYQQSIDGCMTKENVETRRTRQLSWTNYDGCTEEKLEELITKQLGDSVKLAVVPEVTVTSEGETKLATVTGLKASYTIGETVSFSVAANNGDVAKAVKVNGNAVAATEGVYSCKLTTTALVIDVTVTSKLEYTELKIDVKGAGPTDTAAFQEKFTASSTNAVIVTKMKYAKAATDTDYQFGVRIFKGKDFDARFDIKYDGTNMTFSSTKRGSQTYTYTNVDRIKSALAGEGLTIVAVRQGTNYTVYTDDGTGTFVQAFTATLDGNAAYTRIGFGCQKNIASGDVVSGDIYYFDNTINWEIALASLE